MKNPGKTSGKPTVKRATRRPGKRAGSSSRNVRRTEIDAKTTSRKRRIRLWRLTGIIGIALLLFAGGAHLGLAALSERGVFQVDYIEITGQQRISEERILARLNLPERSDLTRLDLDVVSRSVLSHPWIERVNIRRLYPSTLKIHVWERTPVALLSKHGKDSEPLVMVDREGVLLGKPDPAALALPRLMGIDWNGRTTGDRVDARRVRAGVRVATAYGKEKALVDITDVRDPLLLSAGMRVRVGDRGGYDWRFERLHRLENELKRLSGKHGAEVDLRHDDRVVARPL
ncbi:MAG: cell division protein FtsQ/DivIB [Leptospirillia bacterium]